MSKTASMLLRDYALKENVMPVYKVTPRKQIIHNDFQIEVKFMDIIAIGKGSSKRIAKENAAFFVLRELIETKKSGTKLDVEPLILPNLTDENVNLIKSISTLQVLCAENKFSQPIYRELSEVGPQHNRKFTLTCELNSLATQATSHTKKHAKHLCAQQMLDKLEELILYAERKIEHKENKVDEILSKISSSKLKSNISYNPFVKMLKKRHLTPSDFKDLWKSPKDEVLKSVFRQFRLTYSMAEIQGPPKVMVVFHANLNCNFTVIGVGSNRERAERNAIKKAFETLKTYIMAIDCKF